MSGGESHKGQVWRSVLPDDSSVIILLIFLLGIVFISEVFNEENIRMASYKERQEKLFSASEEEASTKTKASSHLNKGELPSDFHTVSIRYENGHFKEQGGIYRDQNGKNVRHGKWSFWAEDGKKIAEEHYRRGKPVGTWVYWDKEGKVIKMKNYSP